MKERCQKFFQDLVTTVSGTGENSQLLRTSRSMLLIAVVTYPLFGFAHLHSNARVVDPLTLRLGFAVLCVLVYAASYLSSWVRTHINAFLIGLYYLLTSHFLLLLAWNRFSIDYVIGFLTILFCLGVVLINKRALLGYCAFLLTGVLLTCTYAGAEVVHAPLLLGAVTVLCVISLVMLNYRLRTTAALFQTNQQLRQEIAERSQAEEKLRTSEAQHRLLTEYATDLIAKQTFEGVILYASSACQALLGYTPTEMIGRSVYDFFHPADIPAMKKQYEDLSTTPDTLTFTYRIRRKDGVYIWFETTNRALYDAKTGMIKEFLSISRDITVRKEAEQLKDELVSTVSHELRTPLTSLRGFTELMLSRDFSREKQREFLAIIHSESVRLTNLINDFLDLQRIESGRQVYHFADFSLPALLHESVSVFSGGKEQRPFHLVLPPHFPTIRADRDRIQQVLANLFSNAVKFSPDGSAVVVGAQLQDGEAVVWVKDQGVGIPPEAMSKLFSKFFRVDNRDTRTIGGTGLGLALMKEIIAGHNGRVWVESTLGFGSTFFFTLPFTHIAQRDEAVL